MRRLFAAAVLLMLLLSPHCFAAEKSLDKIAPRMNVLWAIGQGLADTGRSLAALARSRKGLASLPTAQISSDITAVSSDISVVTLFYSVRPLVKPEAEEEFARRFLVNLLAEKKEDIALRLEKILDFYDELSDAEAAALARSAETPIRRSIFEMNACLKALVPGSGGAGEKAK